MYTFSVAGEWAGRLLGRWYQRGVLRVGGERGLMGGGGMAHGHVLHLGGAEGKAGRGRGVGGVVGQAWGQEPRFLPVGQKAVVLGVGGPPWSASWKAALRRGRFGEKGGAENTAGGSFVRTLMTWVWGVKQRRGLG